MADQAKAIGDKLKQQIAHVAKALILEIDANLRKTTPVDTGHARANWVPSVGQPHEAVVQGDAAHASGVALVLSAKPGEPLYETNNVPYVNRLNQGHSQQAPALFIEEARDQAIATIRQRYAGSVDVEKPPPGKLGGGP